MSGIPREIAGDFAHARRLEWWTLFWIGSVVVVMFFATGHIVSRVNFDVDSTNHSMTRSAHSHSSCRR